MAILSIYLSVCVCVSVTTFLLNSDPDQDREEGNFGGLGGGHIGALGGELGGVQVIRQAGGHLSHFVRFFVPYATFIEYNDPCLWPALTRCAPLIECYQAMTLQLYSKGSCKFDIQNRQITIIQITGPARAGNKAPLEGP